MGYKKHHFKFTSLGREDLFQIAEPIGYDGATFLLEQEPKRYGRDYQIGAINKLTFINAYAELGDNIQVIDPLGNTSNRLNYGFEWLLYIWKKYGFEAKVEYFIEDDGLFLSNGMLDFTEKGLTDGYTYISCKLIQNQVVADVKRRFDDTFNAFSTKNAKEDDITPMPTFNYLKRAVPIFQRSKWKYGLTEPKTFFLTSSSSFNFANAVEQSDIENTLSYIQGAGNSDSFRYVRALNYLSQVKIRITNLDLKYVFHPFNDGSTTLKIRVGQTIGTATEYNLQTITNPSAFNSTFSLDLDFVQRTDYIWIYFRVEGDSVNLQFTSMDVEISGISTAIDQVIKASRWIDLIKQASKFTSNLPINAPLFDAGGEHYKNVVFNRGMVSQKTETFNATTKDVFNSVSEVNCDYEISDTEIQFLQQESFYQNQEIAVLEILPDYDATQEFNDKNMINKFRYGYETYEQDRTSVDTNQSFHTDSEWRFLNEQVENFKDVKNKFVRDGLATQKMINIEVDTPTTSTDQDDKIYIENYTELAPSSFGTFGSRLLLRGVDGQLEILNQTSDATNVVFNWTNLGFGVGSVVTITYDGNTSDWNVVALSTTVLTLTPVIGFVSDFQEDAFIVIKYYYTDVAYQTRTNQGFSLIEGINNVDAMPNLAYSIKRNMKYFYSYFATCLMYSKKNIINAYFKSNGALTTQLTTETEPLTENAPILYSDLPTPKVNATTHNLKLIASFNDIYNYLNDYKTVKGFIRCYDYNGKVIRLYPTKLEQTWVSNELEIKAEEQFSTEFLTIDGTIGNLFVNDAPYNLSGIENWWKFENNFIQLFDEKSRPLSTKYEFNFVVLNGVIYNTKNELINALLLLNE